MPFQLSLMFLSEKEGFNESDSWLIERSALSADCVCGGDQNHGRN